MDQAEVSSIARDSGMRAGESLGFTLNFISGKGLLTCRDKKFGPLEMRILELEIPRISFPFDVTGGAERFKTHRCALRHLVLALDTDKINNFLQSRDLRAQGFLELRCASERNALVFFGRFAVGEHQADFTLRAALLLRSPRELDVVFYEPRIFGWLPVPACLLPVYLYHALRLPFVTMRRAGLWSARPSDDFLREFLPHFGWKIPDVSTAGLVSAEVSEGQVVVVAGPDNVLDARKTAERDPSVDAIRALEGVGAFTKAEEALVRGELRAAYSLFQEAADDERGGIWPRERMLQIGAADPELVSETRQLAEELLREHPERPQPLLALASLALYERALGDAASRFSALADIAHQRKERHDVVAAELAAGNAAAPIDPRAAIASLERAVARSRDSVVAQRALFDLRCQMNEWGAAATLGERLLKLEDDLPSKALLHHRLGTIYARELRDLKKARIQFERSLRITPENTHAMEGLAETYAARGEPARAASYLERLAEQAEQSGDKERIVTLNLRLGETWERWLGDLQSAAERYKRVLDVQPANRAARLRLAKIAEEKGDLEQASFLYEDIVASEEETVHSPQVVADVVTAYVRLARVALANDGHSEEALRYLERAVDLAPRDPIARHELAELLHTRGAWPKLIALLTKASEFADTIDESKPLRMTVARLEVEKQKNVLAALQQLQLLLKDAPADREALEYYMSLLSTGESDLALAAQTLGVASDNTPEPVLRSTYLWRLAQIQKRQGIATELLQRTLEHSLDANPFNREAAEELIRVTELEGEPAQLLRAYDRLAVASTQKRDRADAQMRRARILVSKNSREEAELALRQAVFLDPSFVDAWVMLAEVQIDAKKLAEARQTLEETLKRPELSRTVRASLYEKMAALAKAANDGNAEARYLKEVLADGSRKVGVLDRYTQVMVALGKGTEAATDYETWGGGDADLVDSDLLVRAADMHASLGDFAHAVTLYRRVAKLGTSGSLTAAQSLEKIARQRGDVLAVSEALSLQLAFTDPAEHTELLYKILQAQQTAGQDEQAEATAQQLIATGRPDPAAYLYLAGRCENRGEFINANKYLVELLEKVPRATMKREARREIFERAAAIALEEHLDNFNAVETRFDEEFPEAPPRALHSTLAEWFARRNEWARLLQLRRQQLTRTAEGEEKIKLMRDAAEILHHRLERGAEAIPLYQEVLAVDPHDEAASDALLKIYEGLGQNGDLAQLLFAKSQWTNDPKERVDYGIRSAEVYEHQVGDRAAARQVLMSIVTLAKVDVNNPHLLRLLREFEMYSELVQVLELSLGDSIQGDDGRLAELVEVLEERLGEPARALRWCQQIAKQTASSAAFRLTVNILQRHPNLGDVAPAYQMWANSRQGAQKAEILLELADYWRDAQKAEDVLEALKAAAEADPDSIAIKQQLYERYSARGEWMEAATWLERVTFLEDDRDKRNSHLRRLVEIATDFVDEPKLACRSLASLSDRSAEETRQLAQLYIQLGDIQGLSRLEEQLDQVGSEALLGAAKALVAAKRLDLARRYLERCLLVGDPKEVWELASEAWRREGKVGELGKWRLEYAAAHPDRGWLKLIAYAELVEGGDSKNVSTVEPELAEIFENIDWSDAEQQWAVFSAGKATHNLDWTLRAAELLERSLRSDDRRLSAVLRARVEFELNRQQPTAAVSAARRLVQLGDIEAEAWLDRALDAAGLHSELLKLLEQRALAAPEEEPSIRTRMAAVYVREQNWPAAQQALFLVPENKRPENWGQLALEIGAKLNNLDTQMLGLVALTNAQKVPEEKAVWMRRLARFLWRSKGRSTEAAGLLREAESLAPLRARDVSEDVDSALAANNKPEAILLLQEALIVLTGDAAAPLWLQLAELEFERGSAAESSDALRNAITCGTNGEFFVRAAHTAGQMEQPDLQVQALEAAFERDVAHADLLIAVLEGQHDTKRLIQVLLKKAVSVDTPIVKSDLLLRAAELTRLELGDLDEAFVLAQQSVEVEPNSKNLRSAFEWAHELGQTAWVVRFGEELSKRLNTNDPYRGEMLSVWVEALDNEERAEQALQVRRELVGLGKASSRDKFMLAESLMESEPVTAGALFEDAAQDPELRVTCLVNAAQLWKEQGNLAKAKPLLAGALQMGADSEAAHSLALDLATGTTRLRSLRRLVEMGADSHWENEKKSELYTELGTAALSEANYEDAHQWLNKVEAHEKPKTWVVAMESVLRALDREDELMRLWTSEAIREDVAWTLDERVSRLKNAASYWRSRTDRTLELQVLVVAQRLSPADQQVNERLVEIALDVGDVESFKKTIETQWDRLSDTDKATYARTYAPILLQQFKDVDGAIDLLERGFVAAPRYDIAELLSDLGEKQSRKKWAADLFMEHVDRMLADDAAKTLLLVARLGRGEHLDQEGLYGVYQRVVAIDPTLREAREFCLSWAARAKRFDTVVEILESAAAATHDADEAYNLILQAAQLCHIHLGDKEREITLLKVGARLRPEYPQASTLLLERLLAKGDLLEALHVYEDNLIENTRDDLLGRQLLQALSAADNKKNYERGLAKFVIRHPDSDEAADYAMLQARTAGDTQVVLAHLEKKLQKVADSRERYKLLLEVIELKAKGGAPAEALALVQEALSSPYADVDVLELGIALVNETGLVHERPGLLRAGARFREELAELVNDASRDRVHYADLLGEVCESMDDVATAITNYERALELSTNHLPNHPYRALRRIFEMRGEWEKLIGLLGQAMQFVANDQERAVLYWEMGTLWQDKLGHEEQALPCLENSNRCDPQFEPARLALGLLLAAQQRYAHAQPLLENTIHPDSATTPLAHVMVLLDVYRNNGALEKAWGVIEHAAHLNPNDRIVMRFYAEVLEQMGRTEEAESAWVNYLEKFAAQLDSEETAAIRMNLAALAEKRNDLYMAVVHLEDAHRYRPSDIQIVTRLRGLYEGSERWDEAAALRQREAALASDNSTQLQHLGAAVEIYRGKLNQLERASMILQKMTEIAPDRVDLALQLVSVHAARQDWRNYLVVGERLLAMGAESRLDGAFFANLARAYQEVADDKHRARDLYNKALERDPNDESLESKLAALAKDSGDYTQFAQVEEKAIARLTEVEEKVRRSLALADLYTQSLRDLQKAMAILEQARAAKPHDPVVLRRLADLYALDSSTYPKAAAAYQDLLHEAPLDTDVLRILARLSGQAGDNERAYGYYAALLALMPSDAEAKRFVDVCRAAQPPGPQRLLADAERVQGLTHVDQVNVLDELFAPMARFVELTQPGDLNRRGVTTSDGVPAAVMQWLRPLLDVLGSAHMALYTWKTGGFAVESELVNPPALLLGHTLLSEGTDRQRAFLVARALELYRTGHSLCERLNVPDMESLVAALCLAVEPRVNVSTKGAQTGAWAKIIATPMNQQIRAAILPKVQNYLMESAKLSVEKWRAACLATATRVAFLYTCDVADAITILLKQRGFDEGSDDQRLIVIRESPEARDLLAFATSEVYFKLRAAIGRALRKTK